MRKAVRWIALGAAALVMVGCGPAQRPGTGARAPVPSQPVYVAVPPPTPLPSRRTAAPPQLSSAINALARGFEGKFGIAIRAIDDGWTVQENARQRLPQQSVSKLWVALTLLDLCDQGKARLDDPITVRPEDLTLFHQPVAGLVKGDGYHTTVRDLFTRALTHSDNTANDRLLSYVGGPPAVRAMIERKQLGNIRFGPGERLLQSKTAGLTWVQAYARDNGFMIARSRLSNAARTAALDAYTADPPDGAAPIAIVDALGRLARGELLSPAATRTMLDTMGDSVTGRARLRAALPNGWEIAHKTGTGQDLGPRNAGFNDVGIITAPDARRYAIAVMIGDTREPVRARQQLIQAVASAVATYADSDRGGLGTAN
jgi:beta-lactamase class A